MKNNTRYQQWINSQFKGNSVKDSINIIIENLLLQTNQHTLPIKISSIAKLIGIDPRPLYFNQSYDGGLININGKLRIALKLDFKNDNRLMHRHRFTYAHELIHCLAYDFKKVPNIRIAPKPQGLEEEYLCNYGAAKLILPTKILTEYLHEKNKYSIDYYSNIIKEISQKANCGFQLVVLQLLESKLLERKNKLYILSTISKGYRNEGKHKPRCVIDAYFDENEIMHKFLGPNKGLEHIHFVADKLIPWSLLEFHENYDKDYFEVENEKLIRSIDGYSFSITGIHVRLNENNYVWSELSINKT
ncbi:MAG: hypothetical protein JWP45_2919 [Mucilaginibacter sp.]|nr:hypothetical protein [Mucilaginibacter sp.]